VSRRAKDSFQKERKSEEEKRKKKKKELFTTIRLYALDTALLMT
jgi:hypothetical protein